MTPNPYKTDFPLFANRDIVYLDNAATSQKPKTVLDAMNAYYTQYCANIHRGTHEMGNQATREYESAREKVARFIGARSDELVFTRGTTESINLVASSFVRKRFKTLIVTQLEHHSNIVPWQLHGYTQGDGLEIIPVDENLNIDMEAYEALLKAHPGSFVSIVHISNAFGIVNPVREMIALAREHGCTVLVDGAQSVAHMRVDVKALDADFYAFSGHKMYAPTGVGALYGKKELLDSMPPYQGGGTMIDNVTFAHTTFLPPPHRFEAGTQSIAQAIGFGAAADYISSVGHDAIGRNDRKLMTYARAALQELENVRFYTDAGNVAGSLSFNIEGCHHSDLGTLLDKQNVFVRTGHHCALPAMRSLGIEGTVRFSFALYSTQDDVDRAVAALKKAVEMLR